MNKALALFLVFAGLAAFVNAADVEIQVGDPTQGNVFVPAKINANPGDLLVFTWYGMHSVFESDSLTSCAKTTRQGAFITSGQAYSAPKTMNFTVPANPGVAKTWIYCSVPGHCTPNTGGMAATIIFSGGESGGAMPPGAMPPGSGSAPEPTGRASDPADISAINSSSIAIGISIGAIIGILLTIGGFLLYKRYKTKTSEDNINNYNHIMQIPGSEIQIHKDQVIPEVIPEASINKIHDHGQETIPISENEQNNVQNHGQEATPISEIDRNTLQDYIVQIVKQEMQNQKNN